MIKQHNRSIQSNLKERFWTLYKSFAMVCIPLRIIKALGQVKESKFLESRLINYKLIAYVNRKSYILSLVTQSPRL